MQPATPERIARQEDAEHLKAFFHPPPEPRRPLRFALTCLGCVAVGVFLTLLFMGVL